jgi:hypothetical protein
MTSETEQVGVGVAGIVGFETRQPLVELTIGDRTTAMPTDKARQVARMLYECAESAEQDGFFLHFLTDRIGASEGQAAMLLREFRDVRVLRAALDELSALPSLADLTRRLETADDPPALAEVIAAIEPSEADLVALGRERVDELVGRLRLAAEVLAGEREADDGDKNTT